MCVCACVCACVCGIQMTINASTCTYAHAHTHNTRKRYLPSFPRLAHVRAHWDTCRYACIHNHAHAHTHKRRHTHAHAHIGRHTGPHRSSGGCRQHGGVELRRTLWVRRRVLRRWAGGRAMRGLRAYACVCACARSHVCLCSRAPMTCQGGRWAAGRHCQGGMQERGSINFERRAGVVPSGHQVVAGVLLVLPGAEAAYGPTHTPTQLLDPPPSSRASAMAALSATLGTHPCRPYTLGMGTFAALCISRHPPLDIHPGSCNASVCVCVSRPGPAPAQCAQWTTCKQNGPRLPFLY